MKSEELSIREKPSSEEFDDNFDAGETPEEKKDQQSKACMCVIIISIIVVVTVVLYLLYGKKALILLHDEMKVVINSNSFWTYFILIGLQFLFAAVLFLPGAVPFNILQAILMKDMLKSWALSFLGSLAASIVVYLLIAKCFTGSVEKRMKHLLSYRLLRSECKEDPWSSAIIFNCLMLPVSVRVYLTSISGLSMTQALVGFIPGPLVHTFMNALVGTELKELSDLWTSKSFSEKTNMQKVEFVSTIVLIVLTAVLMIFLGYRYKIKYDQFKKHEQTKTKGNNELNTL